MNVSVTARHCSLPDSTRRRVEDAVARLTRFDDRMTAIEVLFEKDSASILAEIRAVLPGRGPLLARGRATTYRVALDDAASKLVRQVKRERERRRRHRVTGAAPGTSPLNVGLTELDRGDGAGPGAAHA